MQGWGGGAVNRDQELGCWGGWGGGVQLAETRS